MKKINIQRGEYESFVEKDIDTKIIHLPSLTSKFKDLFSDNYDKEEITYEIKIDSRFTFLFKKIYVIRFMIFISFFFFCFLLIKLKQKESKIFTNKNFEIIQKSKNINNFEALKTNQLINTKNIKISKYLNIDLKLEHSKYIHLEIDNFYYNRWKVPKEILNKEYFDTLDESNININFKIKYKKTKYNFSFELYKESISDEGNIEQNIFYSFTTKENFLYSNNYINFESILSSDDIYGFGERIHKFKLDEGIYTIWPTNQQGSYDKGKGGQNLWGHQPIGLHKTRYKDTWLGFVFLNSNAQDVQIYKNINEEIVLSHKTIGGVLDYYIIVDNSPENIIKDINFLIGSPTLPPYWALGFHQGEQEYNNINEFKRIYNIYKEKEIPFDAIWMNEKLIKKGKKYFKNFVNYIKDKIKYRDHNNFVTAINFGIPYKNKKYNKYKKLAEEYNLFVKSGFTKKNLISKYETGKALIPDFLDPEINILWNKILFDIYNKKANYDGISLENEPSTLRNPGYCQGEKVSKMYSCNMINEFHLPYLPGYNNHINVLSKGGLSLNAYTYNNMIYNNKPLINIYQSKHTYNFLTSLKKRPFIITKANSFGSGKYSFHSFGDNNSINSNIENTISSIFTYNIFGMPFTGGDICGNNNNINSDKCIRWYNIGSFFPFMKSSNNKELYPWSFGTEVENIIKKGIQTRYSLLRYIYSQLFLVSINEKGSFFKPVMFEFPEDEFSYDNIEGKIMFGEAFLICPFYNKDEEDKEFLFPNANFNRYPRGENINNFLTGEDLDIVVNRKKILSGKLDELHIFLRGGFIIPMQDTFEKYVMNTYYLRQEKLNLIINPDNRGCSYGTIFFDNDESDTLQENKFIRVDLEFKDKILKIVVNSNDVKYIYSDDILNIIEIWRINEIFKEETINKGQINIKIQLKNEYIITNGFFYKAENKMKIYFVENVSLFEINEINFINHTN